MGRYTRSVRFEDSLKFYRATLLSFSAPVTSYSESYGVELKPH